MATPTMFQRLFAKAADDDGDDAWERARSAVQQPEPEQVEKAPKVNKNGMIGFVAGGDGQRRSIGISDLAAFGARQSYFNLQERKVAERRLKHGLVAGTILRFEPAAEDAQPRSLSAAAGHDVTVVVFAGEGTLTVASRTDSGSVETLHVSVAAGACVEVTVPSTQHDGAADACGLRFSPSGSAPAELLLPFAPPPGFVEWPAGARAVDLPFAESAFSPSLSTAVGAGFARSLWGCYTSVRTVLSRPPPCPTTVVLPPAIGGGRLGLDEYILLASARLGAGLSKVVVLLAYPSEKAQACGAPALKKAAAHTRKAKGVLPGAGVAVLGVPVKSGFNLLPKAARAELKTDGPELPEMPLFCSGGPGYAALREAVEELAGANLDAQLAPCALFFCLRAAPAAAAGGGGRDTYRYRLRGCAFAQQLSDPAFEAAVVARALALAGEAPTAHSALDFLPSLFHPVVSIASAYLLFRWHAAARKH
ncbi:hypothetical protein DIPPA_33346 [Diplonema papillatum]|nr:hypothetical protein DIPPA_33346 [Diplonema papillatum]|eukprot:gene5054-7763_t